MFRSSTPDSRYTQATHSLDPGTSFERCVALLLLLLLRLCHAFPLLSWCLFYLPVPKPPMYTMVIRLEYSYLSDMTLFRVLSKPLGDCVVLNHLHPARVACPPQGQMKGLIIRYTKGVNV